MHRITDSSDDGERDGELIQLTRIAARLERLERRLDEFFTVFLNARFPYGKPTDRWRRRGAA
jgi:hypothetical protein